MRGPNIVVAVRGGCRCRCRWPPQSRAQVSRRKSRGNHAAIQYAAAAAYMTFTLKLFAPRCSCDERQTFYGSTAAADGASLY